MIKLTTLGRDIATVFTLSFAISLHSHAVVAQESLGSFPTPGSQTQSVLDLPDRELPASDVPDVQADLNLPQDPNVPEDLNVLTRGPLHEAFASAHQADPQPSALVFKSPPELIDEVPPEYKPEGNSVQWISGYWAWDDAQSDFIWISGIWRDTPPDRRWVPGYWNAEGDGYRWISGIWTEEAQLELGYLPEPPASIDQGPSTTAPGEEYFYVPGNWTHQEGTYRWFAGHWQPLVENWIWIPSRYVWTPNGCVYQSGYWDYEVQNRGTCFAPVQFTQPVYLANNYSYRPSFAINLNIDFMTHLFVRQQCGHYFYGDWYASNFNHVRYRPWVSYSSHFRSYDPLLTYYRCRRSSFDRRYNVIQYLTRQHNFYVNNRDYRPRPTYRSQHKHVNNIKHLHASGSIGHRRQHQDFLRKSSYVRTYKDLRTRDDRRHGQTAGAGNRANQQINFRKHHRVAERELRDTRRNVEQLAKVQRERKRKEISGKQRVARKQSGKVHTQDQLANRQGKQEQLRRARERASQATTDAIRRQRRAQSTSRKPTNTDRTGDRNRQRSIQPERRTQPTRNAQQEKARLAGQQQQARKQSDRDLAGRLARQEQARRTQNNQARRSQQDQARRVQQETARRTQEEVRRIQQQQQQKRSAASRSTREKMRMQNVPSTQQREQAARQAQRQLAQKAAQQSQRDATRKAQRKSQQDQVRRAQQDQARRTRQAVANRARQDQARRAQQNSQQERSRQQAARRASQQQAQRAQQQSRARHDAAQRAQANRQKSAQKNRKPPARQSRSSQIRNRSKSKK